MGFTAIMVFVIFSARPGLTGRSPVESDHLAKFSAPVPLPPTAFANLIFLKSAYPGVT
ncbi:MAG: hypothetical protein QOJ39_2362 [Candidatus Eremiobacteraeota bacterium]|nr:hypothetical protein [Candidatus Eremiobacteraeota bacterium]